MTRIRFPRFVLVLCGAALAAAATACTSDAATPDSPVASAETAVSVWGEFVSCARQNGEANMPDPVVDGEGRATFPVADGFDEKRAYEALRAPCGAILDRLPPQVNPLTRDVMTPERLEVLRRYVQCLRDNGMPEMPDPGPNG